MSKLSEMIVASQTNERRAVLSPIGLFTSSVDAPTLQPCHYVYRFKAELGCNATIAYGDSKALESQMKAVRRQVVELLFGEFREDIYAIQRALMDYKVEEARELTSMLYDRMFDV